MSDLISRRAVLDELEKWDWQELYLPIHFKQILDNVPSVENKGEWIPISSIDEIPKEGVWVTRKGADYAYVELIGWDSERNCRTEDGGFRCDDSDLKDVVAYMPYSEPEPYKAESEIHCNCTDEEIAKSFIEDCCEAQGHLWADNNIFEDVEENQ